MADSPLSESLPADAPVSRAALCIGHPGHEIRVMEWMRSTRPLVDILTDGSGSDRASRFHLTRHVLQAAQARLGVFQGRYPDREFYGFILQKSPAPFLEIAQALAAEWMREEIDTVAGDMLEGFSSTHEVCRIIINAATRRVRRETGRAVQNLEFALDRLRPLDGREGVVFVKMDDDKFQLTLRAARTAYPVLADEMDALLRRHGEAAFQTEILYPADESAGLVWAEPEPPYYETYGRQQIALGHYRELITHEAHIRPLAEALYGWADR